MKIPFFRKKKPQNAEVIDIGMLKAIDERNKTIKAAPFQSTEAAPGPASDDFSFLGALASAASEDSTQSTTASSTSSSTTPTAYSGYTSSSGIDPERFERLRRRIDNIIQRMELIERKIERIEHRVDLKY